MEMIFTIGECSIVISDSSTSNTKKFTIADVNDCKSDKQYGFTDGKPCVLIKMNKVCFCCFHQKSILKFLARGICSGNWSN